MADPFMAALEKHIAADAVILGSTLKDAVHNLEVAAATVVSKCVQGHDATPAAQEAHKFADALKAAVVKTEADLRAAAAADLKADTGAIEATAMQAGAQAVADVTSGHPASIAGDLVKGLENSPLAAQVAQQAADATVTAAKDVAAATDAL